MKTENQSAWFLVLPVLALAAIAALIPLMTLVNYSVQEAGANNQYYWAGTRWYHEVLTSERFWRAAIRSLIFSGLALAIETPLGVLFALNLPKKGLGVPICLVLIALPLLTP